MTSASASLPADLPAADLRSAILRATLDEVSASSTAGDGETDCCVICLGDIAEPCESRPCQHTNFDFICLLTWLDQRKSCPLCKIAVTEVRHNFSAKGEKWDTYRVPEGSAAPAPTSRTGPTFMGSLTSRERRPRGHLRPARPSARVYTQRKSDPLAHRRHVYRHRLYSLHVGTRHRRFHCDLTPASFMSNPDLVSRARMFLRRELQVFEFLSSANDADAVAADADGPPARREPGRATTETPARSAAPGRDPRAQRRMANVEFLLEYMISILKTVDTQGSMGQAEALIAPFLGREHTQLLLHELRAFLRSPYLTLESWDRNVQYLSPWKARPTRTGQHPAEREASDNIYPSVWRRGDPL